MDASPTTAPVEPWDSRLRAEVRRLKLRTKKMVSSDLVGVYRSTFRGMGLTFSDLREYQPGDDVKHIHWKATARTTKVYVKSYEEERQSTIVLFLDSSASVRHTAPRRRRALQFSAAISFLALQARDSLGLAQGSRTIESWIPPKAGSRHAELILRELLAGRPAAHETALGPALHELGLRLRRPAVIFIVSDFFSAPFNQELRALAMRHDVILSQIDGQIEQELPPAGLIKVRDAETGRLTVVDAANARVRDAIKKTQDQRASQLADLASSTGASFLRVIDHPVAPLRELMNRRRLWMR